MRNLAALAAAGLVLSAHARRGPTEAGAASKRSVHVTAAEPRAGAIALASAPPQTVELRLPFEGIWGVIQGFDSGQTHVGYAAYALDFVPAERITPRSSQPRRRLDEYPCFGQPVLAPADGRVVWARDGAVDHPPDHHGPHEPGNF